MNLAELAVKPEWRTDTVVQLCLAMREAQDFSAMPILADALQDAGCDDEQVLTYLRRPNARYAVSAGLIGCLLSSETEHAVRSLLDFESGHDCPPFAILVSAAVGRHDENAIGNEDYYSAYFRSENDGEYLHFGGYDAHGVIPPEFWDLVQKATGKLIPDHDRAQSFSCSC